MRRGARRGADRDPGRLTLSSFGDVPIAGLTLDAMGCLVTMRDPVPALGRLLGDRDVDRSADAIGRALRAEIGFYRAHHLDGCDPAGLRALQWSCARFFVRALDLDADTIADDGFVEGFLAALEFVPIEGVLPTLERLHAEGVPMVCVSNWDSGLAAHLERLGIARYLQGVISSGAVGVAKPDPRIFAPALDLLGLPADRVAHLGDEAVDRNGAAAAGLRFLDPPIRTLPERLEGDPGRGREGTAAS